MPQPGEREFSQNKRRDISYPVTSLKTHLRVPDMVLSTTECQSPSKNLWYPPKEYELCCFWLVDQRSTEKLHVAPKKLVFKELQKVIFSGGKSVNDSATSQLGEKLHLFTPPFACL